MVVAVAAGGALGAAARHAVDLALPTPRGGWPWSTLLVNASGCLVMGALVVLVVERPGAHRLVRPFLGVGLLGGYTTFSTYALDVHSLAATGRVEVALAYLVATVVSALLAVWLGAGLTRSVTGTPPPHRASPA